MYDITAFIKGRSSNLHHCLSLRVYEVIGKWRKVLINVRLMHFSNRPSRGLKAQTILRLRKKISVDEIWITVTSKAISVEVT